MLMLIPSAFAHGESFGATAVSVLPEDPSEVWALTDNWGLAHTVDGGDSWEWLCEESLGSEAVYGVVASGPGVAVIATRSGLRTVADDCTSTLQPGPPEDTFFPVVARYGAAGWASGSAPSRAACGAATPTGASRATSPAPACSPSPPSRTARAPG